MAREDQGDPCWQCEMMMNMFLSMTQPGIEPPISWTIGKHLAYVYNIKHTNIKSYEIILILLLYI